MFQFTKNIPFDAQDPVSFFLLIILISIANNTFQNLLSNKPWISDDCKQAASEQESAVRNLWHHPTITNLEALQIKWAKEKPAR